MAFITKKDNKTLIPPDKKILSQFSKKSLFSISEIKAVSTISSIFLLSFHQNLFFKTNDCKVFQCKIKE